MASFRDSSPVCFVWCALQPYTRPVACGDCWCFRLLLALVELAYCQILLKSHYFCSSKDWRAMVLPGAYPPRQYFLLQEHGKATCGERWRETNQLPFPRGKNLIPLCSYLHPLPILLIYVCWVTEEVKRRGERAWFECLRQCMSDDRWVLVRQLW